MPSPRMALPGALVVLPEILRKPALPVARRLRLARLRYDDLPGDLPIVRLTQESEVDCEELERRRLVLHLDGRQGLDRNRLSHSVESLAGQEDVAGPGRRLDAAGRVDRVANHGEL